MEQVITLQAVSKTFDTPAGPLEILKGVSLNVGRGEFVAIVGPSGSGKSTLINMVTGIDRPTRGTIRVAGAELHALNENEIARWRGRNVGVIFQFFQLLPMLTIVENVMLPMDFCHTYPASERHGRAMHLLEQIGMADQAHKLPSAVSGGQQQRAAIARAMANDPALLVADEPTGNLDSKTADAVFAMFGALVQQGKTLVMVTHDRELATRIPRVVRVHDGLIVSDESNGAA
ncbi:MAG: ABC transporter ATP-binding protein [Chloroflexi bacterium]|nr:ABC transporter ATP-binding protein [Chloroflexota bacterium]